jgi:putative component of toxin-antitoxin plasmid stabilization module
MGELQGVAWIVSENILPWRFGDPQPKREGVWECGCGSQLWYLKSNGEVVCTQCLCVTTKLRVAIVPEKVE